ncbi:MAG: Single-stranded DNA-binding protein [Verrucomicrobiales bacterium]|nr:Single-stranded DNA-binding protein [Verrucomicrobiales bacterium]
MTDKPKKDLSQLSMMELFQMEAEAHCEVMVSELLALENTANAEVPLANLMRAAHSIKGAGRMVDIPAVVRVAHAMEDCFVNAQKKDFHLAQASIDQLLKGTDLLVNISKTPENGLQQWQTTRKPEIDSFLNGLKQSLVEPASMTPAPSSQPRSSLEQKKPAILEAQTSIPSFSEAIPALSRDEATVLSPNLKENDRFLKITADNLNRLLALSGESLIDSKWLNPFSHSLQKLKQLHWQIHKSIDAILEKSVNPELLPFGGDLLSIRRQIQSCHEILGAKLEELEVHDRKTTNLSDRLYRQALACRMRPFSDGITGFHRMIRDIAQSLQKQVQFKIAGQEVAVDRDVLEKLEAPLTHLLRNAIDHGIESPDERLKQGKPIAGSIRVEAQQKAGMLMITVIDDGRGIDSAHLKEVIVERKLATGQMVAAMSEAEIFDFLFLPGFSLRSTVTELSGRGVGLDAVHSMIKGLRGVVRISSEPGKGSRFQMQLPLTLSVVRTLLVSVSGEPYALPLAYLSRTVKIPKGEISVMEGKPHFRLDEKTQIGLVQLAEVFGLPETTSASADISVVVIGEGASACGLIVDSFLEERELVVQPLDRRLGKVKDIAAAALLENGDPVLIVDVDDLLLSVRKSIAAGQLHRAGRSSLPSTSTKISRILVVDDSLTVRELERKLLEARGYQVDVAVDGMEGWNSLRTTHYDLVVTDVDMPRMDGIALVTLIRKDSRFQELPVMIVSYKDREIDRQRGLDAGADYYLTKGSFHDESLVKAVDDLIGSPHS